MKPERCGGEKNGGAGTFSGKLLGRNIGGGNEGGKKSSPRGRKVKKMRAFTRG